MIEPFVPLLVIVGSVLAARLACTEPKELTRVFGRFNAALDSFARLFCRPDAAEQAAIDEHLTRLRCQTPRDYRNWCAARGFRATMKKSAAKRRGERFVDEADRLAEMFGRVGEARQRGPIHLVGRGLAGQTNVSGTLRLHQIAWGAERTAGNAAALAYGRLVLHLTACLVRSAPDAKPQQVVDAIGHWALAIAKLAAHAPNWVRDPSVLTDCDADEDDVFEVPPVRQSTREADLRDAAAAAVGHVVGRYGVPRWLLVMLSSDAHHYAGIVGPSMLDFAVDRVVFRHRSPRELTFPIPLSRKAIGLLDRAAAMLTVPLPTPLQLMRAAQTLALRRSVSTDRLHAIVTSRLTWVSGGGRADWADHDSAADLIAWLVAHDDLPDDEMNRVIELFHAVRFIPLPVWMEDGHQESVILDPELSLGRLSTEQVCGWVRSHAWLLDAESEDDLSDDDDDENAPPDRILENAPRDEGVTGSKAVAHVVAGDESGPFVMVPVQTLSELHAEGDAMSHCIGDYDWEVAGGMVEVWSLRQPRRTVGSHRYVPLMRRVTVSVEVDQVSGRRRVTQCARKANQPPRPQEFEAIRQWAAAQGCEVAEHADHPDV